MALSALNSWLTLLRDAVAAEQFVKLSCSKPTPAAGDLKSIDIRPILVKRVLKLSFTYHYKTRDVVKNYPIEESIALLRDLLPQSFTAARLCNVTADHQLAHTKEGWQLSAHAPTQQAPATLAHDRPKQRLLESSNKPYLHALGLTDAQGNVLKNAQDKFRQINKYIEILDGLIKQLPPRDTLRIIDMGAGKGYLTFALYDHVTSTLGMKAEITGAEYRADLVEKCNAIARDAAFTGLRFVQGSIAEHDCTGADVVIALHACDTATDDAIYKAVQAEASLIVVAPCCHKQVRRAMKPDAANPLDFLLQHGTYAERIAEMVTDGMRAQLMELQNYRTKLFEFISDMHTPKNVMIVGIKAASPLNAKKRDALEASLTASKAMFHLDHHYLETLLSK